MERPSWMTEDRWRSLSECDKESILAHCQAGQELFRVAKERGEGGKRPVPVIGNTAEGVTQVVE